MLESTSSALGIGGIVLGVGSLSGGGGSGRGHPLRKAGGLGTSPGGKRGDGAENDIEVDEDAQPPNHVLEP